MAPAEKKARAEGRTVLFVDESGFYLLPHVARTYAPVGRTPILGDVCSREHLSVISAVSPQGELYFRIQDESFDSLGIIRFLKQLLAMIPGKLMIVWDGCKIHHSQAIRDFLAQGAAERIHLERLPAYAPDLNPDEGIWAYLKTVALPNFCARSTVHLKRELKKALKRLKARKDVVIGCFAGAGVL